MNLRRKDFLIFADTCGLSRSSAEKMIAKLLSLKETFINMCHESLLPDHLKERFITLIKERCKIFET